jgi:hypothetical protein
VTIRSIVAGGKFPRSLTQVLKNNKYLSVYSFYGIIYLGEKNPGFARFFKIGVLGENELKY